MYLRQATIEDAELLLSWANDPIVRQNSFNTHKISKEEHYAWFNRVLDSQDTRIFILCDSEPVGTVRLKRIGSSIEISYSISEKYRGNGYGTKIIRLAELEVAKKYPLQSLVAEVKKDNMASQRIFQKLHYDVSEQSDRLIYTKAVNCIVGFRVDANAEIATGHARRCITYANDLEKKKVLTLFFVSDDESRRFVETNGMSAVVLNSRYDRIEDEVEQLCFRIGEYNISKLVVDSYFVTAEYLSKIRTVAKTIYIDDLFSFAYPVDVIVNYSVYADKKEYERLYSGNCPELYLGIKYAPLREEFKNIKYVVRKQIKNILITTGGADRFGVAKKIVEFLLPIGELSNITFQIVSGTFAENDISNARVVIHKNVRNMAQLMADSDLIISAGGFTLYEACSIGVPTLSISFASNQLGNVLKFNELGLIAYCGDIVKNEKQVLCNLKNNILHYTFEIRKNINNAIARIMSSYCDK